MWMLGVILVNEYVAYVSSSTLIWRKKKKNILSLHEFRKSVVLALIKPDEFYPRSNIEEQSVASGDTTSNITRSPGRPKEKRRVTFTTRIQDTKPTVAACRVNGKTLHRLHGSLKS